MDLFVRWALNLAPYLLLYAYFSLGLQVSGHNLGRRDGWKAWVPLLNLLFLAEIAGKAGWRAVAGGYFRGKMFIGLLLAAAAAFPAQVFLADRINVHLEIRALKDQNPSVRNRALQSLKTTAQFSPAAVPAIADVLRDEEYLIRILAAYTLGELGSAAVDATPALCGALGDKEPMVSSEVGRALEKIARDPGHTQVAAAMVPSVAKVLREVSGAAVMIAKKVFKTIGNPALPTLVEMLNDKDRTPRLRALDALRELGQAKAAVPSLSAWLSDEDRQLRWRAAMVLGEVGREAKPAVPALIEAMRDPLPNSYGDVAAGALMRIGPTVAELEPALAPLMKDKDAVVRKRAENVLSTIKSRP